MKIHCFDDDIRKNDADYAENMGSFAAITTNLNKELNKLGLLGSEQEADIYGFSSGIKLDFGFQNKRRFCIGVWETNEVPLFLINERARLEALGNYRYFGLSQQVQDAWRGLYGPNTPIVDIGCDTEFWKPMPEIPKNEKFTILSVTSCNFRCGLQSLLHAFSFLHVQMKENVKLIIKNTDERNVVLPQYVQMSKNAGMDIEYVCERQTSSQIRELYNRCHALVYTPVSTSAGLPVLECGACETPVVVADYCPLNLYPSCKKVRTYPMTLLECRQRIKSWQFPYTFPEGCVDETKAMINWMVFTDLARSLLQIKNNYAIYTEMAEEVRKEIQNKWTWSHSCQQLLKNLNL